MRRKQYVGRHRFEAALPYTRVPGAIVVDKTLKEARQFRVELHKAIRSLSKDCALRMNSLASMRYKAA